MYRFYNAFRLYFYCVIHLTLPPVDARTNLVHKIHGIVICISHYDFVFILKMIFTAETCCWLCIGFIYILLDNKIFSHFSQTQQYGILCYLYGGPGSSVGIATAYGLDGPGVESWWERNFPHLSRPALRPTQPPVQ
jgi:hypothetical protein